MTDEKRIFGRTLEDIEKIAKAIDDWTDGNHPKKSKAEGGDFASAFREGARLLQSDKTFLDVLKNASCD